MIKNEKDMKSDDDHHLKPPKLFIWIASVVTISLIIATQFLPRGDSQYLRGIGVFLLLLGGIFSFVPFYLLSKHGGGNADRTYMQAGKVVELRQVEGSKAYDLITAASIYQPITADIINDCLRS